MVKVRSADGRMISKKTSYQSVALLIGAYSL